MNDLVKKGIEVLLAWPSDDDQKGKGGLIADFYKITIEKRKKKIVDRYDEITPNSFYISQRDILFNSLLSELGVGGLRELIVFLIENDHRYESVDTLDNYKEYKPYPSYLIQFAYLLLYELPKGIRNRKLFEVFWEHKAKVKPGISEQFARKYFEPFIEEGITTKDEIRELTIKDWWRAQEAPEGSLYYGPCWGTTYAFFGNGWEAVKSKLEQEWREKTGREPKKMW